MMGYRNVVLIGFMGSGKTVVGRSLARSLEYDFVDTDEQIQDVTGMSIAQLYRKHGEIRLRSEEQLVIKKLINRSGLVIASGGSLLPDQRNLDLLKDGGFFVLLHAEPEVILQRISRKNNRLLIGGKPDLEQIKQMLEQREEFYRQLADFIINTTEISVDEAVEVIAAKYRQ